jgi:predicted Rossmann fold nucleotide-binding protein DprA/Smf involved in DNA uptake
LTTTGFAGKAVQKKNQRRKLMKDLDALLKAFADGLETMAEGIHAIAKKVDDLAKGEAPEKPTKAKPAAKRKAAAKKKTVASSRKAPKKAKSEDTKPQTAPDKVLEVIKGSGDGVNNQTIMKETGLNQKQVSSALLRLKKYGKIKSVKRGVHTAV